MIDGMRYVPESRSLGVAITTRNRRDIFNKTYAEWKRFMPPEGVLVVIDDASDEPAPGDNVMRFGDQQGIARAKNASIAALMGFGVEHLFLADDDCYPLQAGWADLYSTSAEPHLMFLFKDPGPRGEKLSTPALVYRDSDLYAYAHPRGCLLYLHRSVVDRVGGMRPEFGLWGEEHVEYSLRIHAAGLTTAPFQDVPGSDKYFYSIDENWHKHPEFERAVPTQQRLAQIQPNNDLLERCRGSADYVEYRLLPNVVITTLFTSRPDPQRGPNRLKSDLGEVSAWRSSLRGCKAVVLTDEVPTGGDAWRVPTGLQPYLQRWVSLYQHLRDNDYGWVWSTDGTDVEMLQEPWCRMAHGKLYVGHEQTVVDIPWMRTHHPHYLPWIEANGSRQLLNAGIVGADHATMRAFAAAMVREILDVLTTGGTIDSDMGSFNKVAYEFGDVEWGSQWVTPFKAYQRNDWSCWRHK
ncbi:phage protein [Rhodococcus aetherivorans]|uniref:Phage protein n=1 Tax=Rhodococcus aetherivorans TaxID=191292 RepID=A0ABQ0YI98_9NOCA|nr:phage protein [Rhodococcus aetherivorans]